MKNPLISIVIPVKDSGKSLRQCLESVKGQDYGNHEIIVVDGFSRDDTVEIVKEYTPNILFSDGYIPAARNLGFAKARGEIFLSIDSDMILDAGLLSEVSERLGAHGSLIIPETGFGGNFLSRCKDLEKRCYLNDKTVVSARAFWREAFLAVGGYDPRLIFGEDWDLHSRIAEKFSVGSTMAGVLHNTSALSLHDDLRKAFKYGSSLPQYLEKRHSHLRAWSKPGNFFFIKNFRKLAREPVCGLGLLAIKSLEYSAAFAGYMSVKLRPAGRSGSTRD